jgi:hypothetical protein
VSNWGVCIEIIDAEFLGESACYKVCFVLLNGPVSLVFDLEYPFAAYNVLSSWSQDGDPCSSVF